eukprot:CAMPEP_0202821568 /NCGR_PEP_ID=MMETSP1389-20130828/10466_1 /ASSEMBLY_ACC=CAM_ASM_000865 /TAXON_ID=302021 /ORGANISM="Rhodomonas sp., Strain CCMP768" /LENGTH=31 /DNA_ID= /DNA_START= /DNA_END= /DNA_ORIENTATION=
MFAGGPGIRGGAGGATPNLNGGGQDDKRRGG